MNTHIYTYIPPHQYLGTWCLEVASKNPRTRATKLGEHTLKKHQQTHVQYWNCNQTFALGILRHLYVYLLYFSQKWKGTLGGLKAPFYFTKYLLGLVGMQWV